MNKLLIGTVLIAAVLFSCKPLDKIGMRGYPINKLTNGDYAKLSGNYSNYPDTAVGKVVDHPYNRQTQYLSLFNQFITTTQLGDKDYYERQTVNLHFTAPGKAKAQLFIRDTLIETKILRGKIKNNYFYSRPKLLALPLIPVLFGYDFKRYRIGFSGEYLIVDYSTKRWLFALLAGGARKGYFSSAYKKQ